MIRVKRVTICIWYEKVAVAIEGIGDKRRDKLTRRVEMSVFRHSVYCAYKKEGYSVERLTWAQGHENVFLAVGIKVSNICVMRVLDKLRQCVSADVLPALWCRG